MSHSVRRHLRIEIDAYDAMIRRCIPGYEPMLKVAARELACVGSGLVLDLGAGTGALSETILEAGTASVELLDVDPEMLARARNRLMRFAGRVRFSERSFLETLPRCDGVAASLALHHVPTIGAKRTLYSRIHDALRAGGTFVNADATMPAEPAARESTWRAWADYMVARGVEEQRAFEHSEEWADEDTYFPLEEELSAFESAGFGAECVWREIGMTVVVGRKGA
ncbi:MAG: methyltransferase domain-containing protein [Bryobacterales bacterium]|nr:methyltransferase domain-containing protein [Bryobacterales bacterium]